MLFRSDSVTFAFQGGEPTLAGLDYYKYFTQTAGRWDRRIHVEYAIQTNGLLLDEAWCAFLAEEKFLVGLSLDLLREQHDVNRVDWQGRGTYRRVLETRTLLERRCVAYNVLCTLTKGVARHPRLVWREIEKLDLQYVQFTPWLGTLGQGREPWVLTPERVAAFYISLFQLWSEAYWAGRYRSVKLFDDILNLLVRGIPTACGIDGQCRAQMVVEADGSVFPCDFYCLDQWRTGNLLEQSLEEICRSPVAAAFQARPQDLSALCGSCRFFPMCGGGCGRLRSAVCGGNGKCGYQTFLDKCIKPIEQIAASLRKTW